MAGDFDDGRNQRGFSGNDWDAYRRGQNERAHWDAHVAERDKPAGGFRVPGGFGAPRTGGGGGGGAGGGGLAILLVALVGIVVIAPAALLALVVTPFLVLLGMRRGEYWSFRNLYVPVLKASFALMVLHAGALALLIYGGEAAGFDIGRQIDAVTGAFSGGGPPSAGIAPALGGLAAIALTAFLVLVVPVLGMAAVLRLDVEGYARPLGFGTLLGFTVLSLAGGLLILGAYGVALRLFGRPLPVSSGFWLIGTALVSGLIAAISAALFALGMARKTGAPTGELFRLALPGVFVWALLCGISYYGFRGADPLVIQLVYPFDGPEPGVLLALPAFLLMQVPGAVFLWRWIVTSGFWRSGRGCLVLSLILLGIANLAGWGVVYGVVRYYF